MWVVRVGTLVGALVVARVASADPASEPLAPAERYSLAWVRGDGAEHCPTALALSEEVATRLGRAPFDTNAARAIEIYLAHDASGYAATIRILDRDGTPLGRRQLASSDVDCGPIFGATALAVALLIDPTFTARVAAETPPPASAHEAPPNTEPAPTPPRPTVSPGAAPQEQRAGPRATPTLRESPPQATHRELGHGVVRAALGIGLVPASVPGFSLTVAGRPHPRIGWQLVGTYLASASIARDDLDVDVGLTSVGAEVVATLVDTPLALVAASGGPWLGALRTLVRVPESSAATPIVPSGGSEPLVLGVSAGAAAELHVTRALFVEAAASLLVPVLRRRLTVLGASSPVVWTEPAAGFLGGLGVGLSFCEGGRRAWALTAKWSSCSRPMRTTAPSVSWPRGAWTLYTGSTRPSCGARSSTSA